MEYYDFKGKRYTTWNDETSWSKSAIENGFAYGVWDNKLNRSISYYLREKYGIINSYQRAREIAIELNNSVINDEIEKGVV